MPSPSASLATLRPDLAGSLELFDLAMRQNGFIANRVAPVLEVMRAAGVYGKIPLEQLLLNRDTKRAPGSGYNRGKFKFTTASYATQENGWEEPVDDREAQMYADYFDAEQVATLRAFDAVLTNYEIRVANMIFNATTWTGASLTTAIVNEWDDLVNATPIDDVEAAKLKVYAASGMWPNAVIMNRIVYGNVRRTAQVKDAITASGAGDPATLRSVTAEKLAEVFDVEQVLVGGAVQNTAALGQTAALSNIWSNEYVMVAYVDTTGRGDIRRPALARTFHWGEDGSEIGGHVETYREENVRSEIVRVRHDTDENVMYVQAGHLLSNATT